MPIEAVRDSDGQRNGGLTIKAINTARSAFSPSRSNPLFDSVTVAEGTLQTAVRCTSGRQDPKVDASFSRKVDTPDKMSIQLECGRGTLRKTFGVHCITDVAHVRRRLTRARCPSRSRSDPKSWVACRLTFSRRRKTSPYRAPEDGAETCFETERPGDESCATADPNAPAGQALQTSVSLESKGRTRCSGTNTTGRKG